MAADSLYSCLWSDSFLVNHDQRDSSSSTFIGGDDKRDDNCHKGVGVCLSCFYLYCNSFPNTSDELTTTSSALSCVISSPSKHNHLQLQHDDNALPSHHSVMVNPAYRRHRLERREYHCHHQNRHPFSITTESSSSLFMTPSLFATNDEDNDDDGVRMSSKRQEQQQQSQSSGCKRGELSFLSMEELSSSCQRLSPISATHVSSRGNSTNTNCDQNNSLAKVVKALLPSTVNSSSISHHHSRYHHQHNNRVMQELIWLISFVLVVLSPLSSPSNSLVEAVITSDCRFPSDWKGSWFQKGVPDPIRISETDISEKGFCREISGDKFLIENRQERCVRCMVINQKHANVLQYKETFCLPYSRSNPRNLREVCADITGDASLFSLFRLGTPPVSCPFSPGPFVFSYSRGQGECREPLSTIDSCTEDSRLLFRFQACADVGGSESRVEELSCLGEWKEGSTRYLVGRMEHRNAKTDEDKFRCFVFEKRGDGSFNVAQSGDATCDGLSSAIEGSRTMKLNKRPAVEARCLFPKWLTTPRHWKTLDGSAILDFSKNNSFTTFNMTSAAKISIDSCIRVESSTDDYAEFVVHSTSGCKIGYSCLRMYRRNNHIVEIEAGVGGGGGGHLTKDGSDACSSTFSSQQGGGQRFLSITTFNPALEDCPLEGIFSVAVSNGEEGDDTSPGWNSMMPPLEDSSLFICSDTSVLTSKCSTLSHMQLLSRCSDTTDSTRNFYCHGNWKHNQTTYTIVSSSEDKKQYCLLFTPSYIQGQLLKMHISSGSCPHPSQLTIGMLGSNTGGGMFPHMSSLSSSSLLSSFEPFSHVKRGVLSLNLLDHGKCQSLTSTSGAASPHHHLNRQLSFSLWHISRMTTSVVLLQLLLNSLLLPLSSMASTL